MSSPWPERLVVAVAVATFLGLCAALGPVWDGSAALSDVRLYERYGSAVEGGSLPYRDVALEYPPGALLAFVGPALVTDDAVSYARVFAALMAACGAAAILLTAASLRTLGASLPRFVAALGLVAVTPLLLGDLLLTRFDLLPAALVAAATAALLRDRSRLAAVALGAAVAVKLYPLVLVPVLAAWVWRRRGRREALVALGLAAGTVGAVYLAFAALAPDGVAESLSRQLARPLQIESLGSAVLLAAHHLTGARLAWESSHGSQNLTGTAAGVLAVVFSLAQAAVLVAIWVAFARGRAERERLVRYAAASIVAFVALGKVLSPQFLVWLPAPVALVAGLRGAAAAGLVASACVLTRGWFPGSYWELVLEFDGRASGLVLARDLVLVGALAVLALPARPSLRAERARARSPSPAPSAGRT